MKHISLSKQSNQLARADFFAKPVPDKGFRNHTGTFIPDKGGLLFPTYFHKKRLPLLVIQKALQNSD
jgi:hypothetical protein